MSEAIAKLDSEKRTTRWLKGMAVDLEKTEQFFPTIILPDEEYPEWVRHVEREIAAIMLPVARIKDLKVLTARSMGAILGHSCAMAVWTIEWIIEEAKKAELEAKNSTNEPDLKVEEVPDKQRLDKWYDAMRRVAKKALRSSVDQSYEDMSEFLLGFSNAFARKPKTFKIGEMGNTTFEIYLFLLLFWGFVERLNSVPELHQILVKIFGPYRVGELKRVEKICQRIGLHYRKPGRPTKIETIQTPV